MLKKYISIGLIALLAHSAIAAEMGSVVVRAIVHRAGENFPTANIQDNGGTTFGAVMADEEYVKIVNLHTYSVWAHEVPRNITISDDWIPYKLYTWDAVNGGRNTYCTLQEPESTTFYVTSGSTQYLDCHFYTFDYVPFWRAVPSEDEPPRIYYDDPGEVDLTSYTQTVSFAATGVAAKNMEVWPDRKYLRRIKSTEHSRNITWNCILYNNEKEPYRDTAGEVVVFPMVPEWRKQSELYEVIP